MRREHWHLFLLSALIGSAAIVSEGCKNYVAAPEPTPSVTVTPTSTPTVTPSSGVPISPEVFVIFGDGSDPSLKPGGVDYEYGQRTLALINGSVSSGCVLEKALVWDFQSLHGVVNPALKEFEALKAMQRYFGGAPYPLNANWYRSSWLNRNVVGFTYNCWGGECSEWNTETETRIWTNTRYNLSEEDYAAHLAHELSHQKWAGGFVHWSFHQGSFPYEIGDIVSACIARIQAQIAVKSLVAVVEASVGRPSAKGKSVTPRSKIKAQSTEGCSL